MPSKYEQKYSGSSYYWAKEPSSICHRILEIMPPVRPLRLLDVGCGEGRNAVFFAQKGYDVTAFDITRSGVAKCARLATEVGARLDVFEADMFKYNLSAPFDIIFCHGCLQYVPPAMRSAFLENYKQHTNTGGINFMSVFVKKPFIEKAPDAEASAHAWISGELMTHYHDWRIELCDEVIFDCMSSGIPHKHAMARLIARRML